MSIFIYTLSNPLTDEVRYVGKTSNLAHRLKRHLGDKRENWKTHWVRSLISAGLSPKMEVLEECDASNWEDSEKFWIVTLRFYGFKLTNSRPGGDGPSGWHHSEEAKSKIGNSRKGKKNSIETRLKLSKSNSGKKMCESTRIALLNSIKGNKFNLGKRIPEETRRKISEALTGIKRSPITKLRIGASKIGNKYFLGRKHSAEARAKMSISVKKALGLKKRTVEALT